MSNKLKCKTFIVHQNGTYGQPTVIGRFRVGAKNEKDAERILRLKIGKHTKVRTYYEEKKDLLPYGVVIKEC